MQALAAAGWVRCWQYASTSHALENYYKVTPAGYRLLNGHRSPLPPRGFFRPVSLGLQEHTQSLADFFVHTLVSGHEEGISLLGFHRENDARLCLGEHVQCPDMVLQFRYGDAVLNFFVELDNATEPIFSRKERDSWERKIRFYERYQDACPQRFRVLVLTARSETRHQSILHAASRLIRNSNRRLFYAAPLTTYLSEQAGVSAPCFLDHQGACHAIVPTAKPQCRPKFQPLDPALAFC